MDNISLTVPLKEAPLRRAAAMLAELAEDCTSAKPELRDYQKKAIEVARDTLTEEEIAEGDAQLEADKVETPAPIVLDAAVVFGDGATAEALEGAEALEVNLGGAPAETAASTVDLDTEGIPWDNRIHTNAKTKIRAGTWKLKRSIDVAEVEKVKAELLANQSLVAPAVTETTAAEPILTPAAQTVTTFPELVTYVTARCNAGEVQQMQIEELVAKHGITGGLPAVANREDLIPTIYADMVKLWPTTQG